MSAPKATRTLIAGLMCCAVMSLAVRAAGEQPPAKSDPEEPKQLNKRIEDSVTWYDVFPDDKATTALTPAPVCRWRNVVRGQEGEAMMVVWAHNGRPAAIASIYPWNGKMCHEFDSFSREAKLVAREKDAIIWAPQAPGAEFKPVPKAPAPARTTAERLRQMKTIAEGFRATMTGWMADNSDQQLLRFRPRELHRYDLASAKEPDPKLIDGALFAYVQDTDPEVVMAIEAIGDKDKAEWHYACVRATSGGLEVKFGDEVVWTAKKHPNARNPKLPHFTMQRVLEK